MSIRASPGAAWGAASSPSLRRAPRKSRVGILSAFAPLHGADLFRSSGYSASDILPLDLGDDYSMDLLVMRKRLTA